MAGGCVSTCRQGHETRDNDLVCLTCVYELNRKALREHQGQFLATASRSPDGYLLTRRAARGVIHIQLFGAEMTFCDEQTMSAWKRGRIEWDFRERSSVCKACLDAVAEIRAAYTGGPIPIEPVAVAIP